MSNDIIAQSLGVTPMRKDDVVVPAVEPATKLTGTPVKTGGQAEVTNDFEMARHNLLNIIQNGTDAIDSLAIIANQSQDTEAFVALSSLMNTLVSANRQLLEIQKRIRDINKEDTSGQDKNVTNNLFVGSSAELLKIIKGET